MTESRKQIAFMFAERQGLHPHVLQPLRGMYRELRRRFVMASHVEKEFVASNGVIQGCLVSVLLLNLLMNSWARSVKAGITTALSKVYVRNLDLSGEQLDVVSKLRSLGIQFRCARRMFDDVAE